jgi:outer membrane protein assembly factor BamB
MKRFLFAVVLVLPFLISACNTDETRSASKPVPAEPIVTELKPAPQPVPPSTSTVTVANVPPATPSAPLPPAPPEVPKPTTPAAPVAPIVVAQPAPPAAPPGPLPAIVPLPPAKPAPEMRGWLAWRGPHQTGASDEKNLPDTWELGGKNDLWTYKVAMRGTPVIANGQLFGIGYEGEKADLQEILFCLDAETGQKKWEFRSNDFLSDVVYDRYSIGAPAVDPETGYVYYLSTPGILYCFNPDDGKINWKISLTERYGRNTYPNGRTGAPVVEGDLIITRGVTNNWGSDGPPNDRFYGFDKLTGELVWASTPGVGPPFLKDSSVSHPFVTTLGNKRVFTAGTGDGNIVCINANTGEAVWRYQYCVGGINSSTLVHRDGVIAVHGLEQPPGSPYGTDQGAITMLKLDAKGVPAKPGDPGAPALEQSAVIWRNKVAAFSSSPILVGDRIYQTSEVGALHCFDAKTGKHYWEQKFAPDQVHASPVWGDGKLYVPFNNGTFVILKPSDEGVEELARVKLDGYCLGAPAIWNGKVYLSSLTGLHAFGAKRTKDESPVWPVPPVLKVGAPAKLQSIPAEVVLHPGEKAAFRVRAIDADGHVVGLVKDVKWDYFIPPTAKVRSQMDAKFNDAGELVAGHDAKMSAGSFKVTAGPLSGTMRGRVLGGLPYAEDFEKFVIDQPHETEKDEAGKPILYAYPPLAWIKARFSWEIREVGGNKVLAKTLDRLILQRTFTFIEDESLSNYTMQADVMTDGNRRLASDVGLINQRYQILLKGNHQQLEISSTIERMSETVPVRIDAKKWYTLKTRVDTHADGTGVIRAKVWERGTAEPEAWTLEVNHSNVHKQGSPGLYGFAINGKFRVYIDNIKVDANK